MINKGTLDYFSVLVIGDEPDTQIFKFDSMDDVDTPYILYKFSDLSKLRRNKIKIYKALLSEIGHGPEKNAIIEKVNELKKLTDEQYYAQLGELDSYDIDKNIISFENPDGKWLTCEKGGRIFSNYMKDYNDNGIISGKKKDIDWRLTHMREDKVNVYNRTWDLCVNNVAPETDKDVAILNNMKPYKILFKSFKDKEEYIRMSCSFWTYAVIQNGEWSDMEVQNEHSWIVKFYDKFIKDLSGDELITIYECTK